MSDGLFAREEEADICVIGSGLAGLSAVHYLLNQTDIDDQKRPIVALVEARNRPGGRTHTITLDDLQSAYRDQDQGLFTVDVGGQWIGTDHSAALKLISRYGLGLDEQIYPHFENDSTNLLASLVSMVSYHPPGLTEDEEKQVNDFVRLVDELGSRLSLDSPWELQHPEEDELDMSVYDYVVKTTPSPRSQQEIFIFIQTILATSPRHCSFLFFLYYIASGGGMRALGDGLHGAQRWKVIGGAQRISDCLLEELLLSHASSSGSGASAGRFKYFSSTPVTSISSSPTTIADCPANSLLIRGRSPSGSLFSLRCRRVILAMSPRLSNSSIQFSPPLPPPKLHLADAMVPGACVKVLIPYAAEFWLCGADGGPIKGAKPLAEIYPIHNLFHSTVGPLPALVGLITGDHAHTYLQLTADERKEAVLNQIHSLFCSHSEKSESQAYRPLAFVERSWVSEEFSGGCFACLFRPHSFREFGPHLKTSLAYPHLDLSAGAAGGGGWQLRCDGHDVESTVEKAIVWASTETAPLFSGYMEGALLAGEDAAKRILSSLVSEAREGARTEE
jgi:monoamine oxidase